MVRISNLNKPNIHWWVRSRFPVSSPDVPILIVSEASGQKWPNIIASWVYPPIKRPSKFIIRVRGSTSPFFWRLKATSLTEKLFPIDDSDGELFHLLNAPLSIWLAGPLNLCQVHRGIFASFYQHQKAQVLLHWSKQWYICSVPVRDRLSWIWHVALWRSRSI